MSLDNPDKKSQLCAYFSNLCVKCGSVHNNFDEKYERIQCAGCKNTWEYLKDDEYSYVLDCLENKFEVDLEFIKIPQEFRAIDESSPEEVRAAEIAKFISENNIYQ